VLIPDFTFAATGNAVAYTGAKVVPVDIDEQTLCIGPSGIEAAITSRTRAIIAVHIFGHPDEMDAVMEIGKRHDLFVIEDASEAHGAEHRGRKVGSIGHCGAFSFFANKIITSGEGGMVTTNDEAVYTRAKHLRDHAMS